MTAIRQWPMYQLDMKNAYFHGELQKDISMKQLPGFVAQDKFTLVCKLHRSLYGLKQSSRVWFGHFSTFIQEFGMV